MRPLVWAMTWNTSPNLSSQVRFGEELVHERLVKWEPPIGIEPMTYALRVRRSSRLS